MVDSRMYPSGSGGPKFKFNGDVLEALDDAGLVIYSVDPASRTLTVPSGATLSVAGTSAYTGTQTFDDILGGDAILEITGAAPASATAAGGALALAGGVGGATSGAGGAVSFTGGVGTLNDVGGIASVVGGAGHGTAAGGAGSVDGGVGGATGAGGAVNVTGGVGGATSGLGGAVVIAGGAGALGDSAGGLVSLTGGLGSATNSAGGAAALVGGAAAGTGTGGAVTITGGASAGGTGTAGDVTIAPGAPAAGTEGSLNLCTAVTQKLGLYGVTAVVQPAGAAQVAPAAYATGAFGLDSDAKMQALFDLVVAIRLALVNTGVIKGAA